MDWFDPDSLELPFNPVTFTRFLSVFSGMILAVLTVGVAFHVFVVVFGVTGIFIALGVAMLLSVFISVFLAIG